MLYFIFLDGICSYHVFKPNTVEFPFTVDIKHKLTGEAVIQVLKKDNSLSTQNENQKPLYIDCNKRKDFNFLIQAHDCSTPSLASKKYLSHFFFKE
jgi:hypothetical protein